MATFPGTNANDTLLGGADNDSIQGFQGNDYLVGNAGNDTILGAKGDDVIYGGDGNDSLVGAQNNDIVQGGAGNDTLDETGDTGVMNTTTGEFLPGGSNLLAGNAGNDTIWGGTGSDTIQGGQGNDLLLGNGGNDAIYTGMGTDIVFGGQGGDTINIASNNTATTLYYNTSMTNVDGVDTINGFVVGTDKITLISLDATANQKLDTTGLNALALTGTNLSTAIANALASQETDGTDRILTLDNGTTLILKGIGADLTGSSFNGFVGQVLTVVPATVAEGNSGTTPLTFNLTLSSAPATSLTVNYQTLTTGTATAGTDFSAANSSVIFAAGETTKTVTINVIGDTTSESDETVKVQFSATGIDTVTATGTITNDDAAAPTFTLTSDKSTVQEGTAVTFTVTATSAVAADTALTYNILGDATGGLTAATGTDFGTLSGTMTILAGATTGTFTVIPTSDGVAEGLEGFKVSLYNSSLANVATSQALAITDGASSGQTYTLTTTADNVPGTSGNDTINGTLPYTGAIDVTATLTPGDIIVGGTGTDTLNITVSGSNLPVAATATINPNVSGVEKILVANVASETTAGDYQIVDLSLTDSALTTIGTSSSTSAGVLTKFSNVATLADMVMAGKGDLEVAYTSSSITGSVSDAVNVTLNGVGTSATARSTLNLSTGGVETANITSSIVANYLTLTDTGLKTLNVSGDKSAYVAVANTVTKVVSTATAAVSAEIATGSTLANDTVTGGSATTDALVVNDNVTAATDLAYVSGIEVLAQAKTSGTITLAAPITGISTFDLSNINTQTVTLNTGYTGDTTVKIGVSSTGGAGVSDDVVTNNANVNLTVTGNVTNFDTAAITGGTGTDTLTMTANGGTASLANLSSTTTTVIDKINILPGTTDPTSTATLTGLLVATGKTTVVDASALTSSGATFSFTSGAAVGSLSVTGGAGNDTLNFGLSTGNVTVGGGSGNDTITAAAGAHSINGGDGNDSITVTGSFVSSVTVDGGVGTDTLVVSSLSGTNPMSHVSNVENIQFSSTATSISLSSSLGAGVTLDMTDPTAQSLTLASGYTGDTTVKIGPTNADTVINSANIALAVTGNTTYFNNATITGGTGTDTLTLTADALSAALGSVTNVEKINIAANATTTSNGATLTGLIAAAGKTATVDASALTNSSAVLTFTSGANNAGTLAVTGGAGNDTISLVTANTSTTGVYGVVNGGAGNDTITGGIAMNAVGTASVENDSINGGDGNDSIIFGVTSSLSHLDFNDTVDGGAGTDTLQVSSVASGMLAHVTNVEILKIGGITSATFGSDAVGFNTFDLTDILVETLVLNAGFSGDTTVQLGTVNADIVTNNANVNLTLTGNVANFNGTITGGTGTDTLKMTANTVGVTIIGTSIDAITILANTTTPDNGTGAITMAASTIATGKTLTVDASALTNSGAVLNISGAATTTTGKMSVTGGAGKDSITGTSNADTIVSGAGDDSITGGTGLDSLTGGAGNDVFVVTPNSNSLTFAQITDASTGDAVKLDLRTGASAATPVQMTLSAGATTLSDYVNAAASAAAGTNGALNWFQFGGNTYMVADNNASSTFDAIGAVGGGGGTFKDEIIQLNGLVDLSSSVVTVTSSNAGGTGVAYWTLGATTGSAPGTPANSVLTLAVNGAETLVGDNGNDVFSGVTDNFAGDSDKITGGTGTDTISLSDDGITIADVDFTNVTSVEKLTLTGISTVIVGSAAKTAGLTTVVAGAGATTVTATVLTGLTIDASGIGANALALDGAGTTNYTVSLPGVASNLIVTNGTGTLAVTTAAGYLGTIATGGAASVSVTGGAAADTITVTGLDAAAQTFTGDGAKFLITTGASETPQTITTGAYDDTINSGIDATADTLIGAGGNDTFGFTTQSSFVASNAVIDSVSGGSGTTDAIKITAAVGFTVAVADILTRITGVEQITAGSSAGEISLTFNTTNLTSGVGITTVDLSGDLDDVGSNVISNTGATGITSIVGSVGVDTITLKALATAASITGGAGADVIGTSAATTADTIIYATQLATESGVTYADGAFTVTSADVITPKIGDIIRVTGQTAFTGSAAVSGKSASSANVELRNAGALLTTASLTGDNMDDDAFTSNITANSGVQDVLYFTYGANTNTYLHFNGATAAADSLDLVIKLVGAHTFSIAAGSADITILT